MSSIVTVKDIVDFMNEKANYSDYPKLKTWQIKNEKYRLNSENLNRGVHIRVSFEEHADLILRVENTSFIVYKDVGYSYGEDSYDRTRDLSVKWRNFMLERHPEYAEKLKKYAEKNINRISSAYNRQKEQTIRKMDMEYQDTIKPFQDMIALANSKLEADDKELD